MKKLDGTEMSPLSEMLFKEALKINHIYALGHGIDVKPFEVDRRSLTVNGVEIVEKEMSDGTFEVYVDGKRTNKGYWECVFGGLG